MVTSGSWAARRSTPKPCRPKMRGVLRRFAIDCQTKQVDVLRALARRSRDDCRARLSDPRQHAKPRRLLGPCSAVPFRQSSSRQTLTRSAVQKPRPRRVLPRPAATKSAHRAASGLNSGPIAWFIPCFAGAVPARPFYPGLTSMTFRRVAAALGLALGIALPYSPQLGAQAGVQGRWTTLPSLMPINPVHIALMHNGKVLIVAGSGNVATETNYQAAVWDPRVRIDRHAAGGLGHVLQRHGDPAGWPGRSSTAATSNTTRFLAQPRNAVFDPVTGRLHRRREHGARPLVSDGHGARRRSRHDLLRPE